MYLLRIFYHAPVLIFFNAATGEYAVAAALLAWPYSVNSQQRREDLAVAVAACTRATPTLQTQTLAAAGGLLQLESTSLSWDNGGPGWLVPSPAAQTPAATGGFRATKALARGGDAPSTPCCGSALYQPKAC